MLESSQVIIPGRMSESHVAIVKIASSIHKEHEQCCSIGSSCLLLTVILSFWLSRSDVLATPHSNMNGGRRAESIMSTGPWQSL